MSQERCYPSTVGILLDRKAKSPSLLSVILLAEYHANSIRLWRVLLLRCDIRLTPSDIRCASFRANRISLKPQGFNITIAIAIISLFAKAKNITKSRKRESKAVSFRIVLSLRFYCQFRICITNAQVFAHTPIINSPIRTTPMSGRGFFCSPSLWFSPLGF